MPAGPIFSPGPAPLGHRVRYDDRLIQAAGPAPLAIGPPHPAFCTTIPIDVVTYCATCSFQMPARHRKRQVDMRVDRPVPGIEVQRPGRMAGPRQAFQQRLHVAPAEQAEIGGLEGVRVGGEVELRRVHREPAGTQRAQALLDEAQAVLDIEPRCSKAQDDQHRSKPSSPAGMAFMSTGASGPGGRIRHPPPTPGGAADQGRWRAAP